MQVTLHELESWLREPENEHLEFKEARSRFDFEALVKYCAALANEGGGRMVMGVSDRRPRRVVGSRAFPDFERTLVGLVERLHLKIDADALDHPDGRVLVFTVPSRPLGVPVQYKGAYWMRAGESLTPMTPDRLRTIFAEASPDFSAEICPGTSYDDLHPKAVALFRELWRGHSRNEALGTLPDTQLLEDAELLLGGELTYAALILLGTRRALGRHLALSEVIFEFRSHEAHIDYQQRKEYREGFFLFRDEIWETIDLRNDLRFYTDEGFVRSRIPSFNEDAVREAILNAVSHRDYRVEGSIFVRQFPDKIEIVNPGGFPPGITPGNLLWKQMPRNRRIAETFMRCGLIERSGQGANRIFESCILEGKLPPDFRGSDPYQVSMTLHGEIDPGFVRFLKRARTQTGPFDIRDLLVLDAIRRGTSIAPELSSRIEPLCERGILERHDGVPALSRDIFDLTVLNGLDKPRVLKKHVFLSYGREDTDEVRRLRQDLVDAGLAVWWDRDILPGQDWKLEIRQAIKNACAVVLCLSEKAVARQGSGIFPEARDAIGTCREYLPDGIFLIPVRLSECEIPPVPIDDTRTLDGLQSADLFPEAERQHGLDRLVRAIRQTSSGATSSPAAAPPQAG